MPPSRVFAASRGILMITAEPCDHQDPALSETACPSKAWPGSSGTGRAGAEPVSPEKPGGVTVLS